MSLTTPAPAAPTPVPARVPLTWVLVIVLVVAAAAAVATDAVTTARTGPSGPITVTDDLGRTVHLSPNPMRVVALGPNIVDILAHLGLRSHLVGVDCIDGLSASDLALDYTPAQIAAWNLSASMCVEAYPFVPSTLANLTPDIILSSTIVLASGVEQAGNLLGIPVVFLQPATADGILVDDFLVGEIFGVSAAASSLNARLTESIYNATNTTSLATSLPTVLVTFSVDSLGYWSYGPGSFGEALIELAGGVGVGAAASTPYPELSAAQVIAAAPSLIVYATGFGLDLSSYAAGPQWASFSAVQNGSVYGIDSTLLTEPGPTMILLGLPALVALFHPPAV